MCATSPDAPAPYPLDLEREIVLRDGARVRSRPIRPDDERRLVSLYDRLSRFTAYQRFFAAMNRLPPDWAHFLANVDYRRRLALVVENPSDGELIAVARYECTDRRDTAEIAFVVLDEWQNRGLGRMLITDLLDAAEARGISMFVAYVLADNTRMITLLERLTNILEHKVESGVITFRCVRRTPGSDAAPVTG